MKLARRSRRAILFEALEGRELLSGVAAATAEVQKARVRVAVLTGTIRGQVGPGDPTSFPVLRNFVLAGSGRISPLGAVTFAARYQEIEVHSDTISGTGTLARDASNSIAISFGGGVRHPARTKAVSRLTGRVTGGTGTFSGASGTVSASATFDSRPSRFSLQITLRAVRP
jgi:hypothetical protein